ncbi:MAG: 30S ribosomal protein S6 [Thermodesulfobacteriota bacterium]|nr:30S ribosomal protein S6 [Thermodesulfobacteriota bacterium]
MRRYETVLIADPDLQEEAQKSLFQKVKDLIGQEKGILVDFDEWGGKKLAYPINKKPRGYYVCMNYGGSGDLVKELERNFRLDDRVMKFMTILLEKNVTQEGLHKEIEAAEEKNRTTESAEEKVETDTEDEIEDSGDNDVEETEETEEEN